MKKGKSDGWCFVWYMAALVQMLLAFYHSFQHDYAQAAFLLVLAYRLEFYAREADPDRA